MKKTATLLLSLFIINASASVLSEQGIFRKGNSVEPKYKCASLFQGTATLKTEVTTYELNDFLGVVKTEKNGDIASISIYNRYDMKKALTTLNKKEVKSYLKATASKDFSGIIYVKAGVTTDFMLLGCTERLNRFPESDLTRTNTPGVN